MNQNRLPYFKVFKEIIAVLKYTICFIRKQNELLLLNRNKSPNMGMWNGVGGKIEQNESPYESVIRETFEETGIYLEEATFAGNVTWQSNAGNSGMYVFVANLPPNVHIDTPFHKEEGIIDWKDINWVLHSDNKGVVDNIKMYLPKILEGQYGLEHKFLYNNGKMLGYSTSVLNLETPYQTV